MAQAKQLKPEKTRKSDFKFTRDLIDGLAKQNVVLMTGIVNAPVIIAATTFKKGAEIALAFAIISILTIVTCSFVPKKIVYTLRVIIYALVGSVYYIPYHQLWRRPQHPDRSQSGYPRPCGRSDHRIGAAGHQHCHHAAVPFHRRGLCRNGAGM